MNKQRLDEIRSRVEAADACVYFMKDTAFRDLAEKDITDLLDYVEDLEKRLSEPRKPCSCCFEGCISIYCECGIVPGVDNAKEGNTVLEEIEK